MKVFILAAVALLTFQAKATTACTDYNTQTRIAREAVKSMIALADVPNVVNYYGGVDSFDGGFTVVNVQPHFQFSKDWYKVSVRDSDCRVTNVTLFAEHLPIE